MISKQALLWDFVDTYYRRNWFLKAFGDLSFTSEDYFHSILLLRGLRKSRVGNATRLSYEAKVALSRSVHYEFSPHNPKEGKKITTDRQ